jgi:hypothetical protein
MVSFYQRLLENLYKDNLDPIFWANFEKEAKILSLQPDIMNIAQTLKRNK